MIFVHVLCGLLPQAGWFPSCSVFYHCSTHSWFTAILKQTPSVLCGLVCCYAIGSPTHTHTQTPPVEIFTFKMFDKLQQMMQPQTFPMFLKNHLYNGPSSVQLWVNSDRQAQIRNTEPSFPPMRLDVTLQGWTWITSGGKQLYASSWLCFRNSVSHLPDWQSL